MISAIHTKWLGLTHYNETLRAMQQFTAERSATSIDELWICQHHNVFTQGQAGKPEYIHQLYDIPLVHSDRGGQVTFHAPGQWIFYPLIDLSRRKLGVKAFVHLLEDVTIRTLANFNITAERIENAPGLYVQGKKIASLGLKIKHGRSYHGLSLNTSMDLTPFQYITPCGLKGMQTTQISDHQTTDIIAVAQTWQDTFCRQIELLCDKPQV